MIVVPPITITDAMLTSSIPEPDASVGEVVWNAATNYTAGTRVIRTTTHKIYERIGLAGVDAGLPEVTPSKWVEVGPTNKWAMFDANRSSYTRAVSAGTTTITISLVGLNKRASAFALLNSNANSLHVTGTNSGNTIFNSTYDLTNGRFITSYYDYFFAPFRNKSNFLNINLPVNINNSYTFEIVTIAEGKIGGLIIGSSVPLGDIQVGASVGQYNFSKIERDPFGTALLIPRRSVPKTQQKVLTHKNTVNKLLKLREDLNAVPAVWVGLEDTSNEYFDALLIYGVYKDFSFNMEYPDHTTIDIELEEV